MKKLVGFIATIAVLASMANHEAMARELTAKEKAVVEKSVKRELLDPESARFKWVKFVQKVDMKAPDTAATYCGLVNAKNKMGGYVGDMPYLAVLGWKHGKVTPYAPVLLGGEGKAEGVLQECAKAGYTEFFLAE